MLVLDFSLVVVLVHLHKLNLNFKIQLTDLWVNYQHMQSYQIMNLFSFEVDKKEDFLFRFTINFIK